MEGIVAEGSEVGIKKVGSSSTVPGNGYARLMYYLRCISDCIPNFNLPTKYTDYDSQYHLSDSEEKEILVLAFVLDPALLMDKLVFVVPHGSPALSGRSNEFYEISETHRLGALAINLDDFVVIKGERVKISKIMLMSEEWLKDYYFNPFLRLTTKRLETENAPTYQNSNGGGMSKGQKCLIMYLFFACAVIIGLLLYLGVIHFQNL